LKSKDGTNEDILPHYGYEIEYNGDRVTPPGPGHIYIDGETSKFCRNGKPMHEIFKGDKTYNGKLLFGDGYFNTRIDHAMRLWVCGADPDY